MLYPNISWSGNYFQGSSGYDITWVRLVDTFIQNNRLFLYPFNIEAYYPNMSTYYTALF